MQKIDFVLENADVIGVKVKSIRKLEEKQDVYCLGTENGNFLANGIIVKNCDALRYAAVTHKIPEYKPYKDATPDEYLSNRFNVGARRF